MSDKTEEAEPTVSVKASVLSELIKRSYKTQTEIAAEAHISPAHLSRILSGAHCPTDETFFRIAQAAGLPVDAARIALLLGPQHLRLVAHSDFMVRLAELPHRLAQSVPEQDLIDADPQWADSMMDFLIVKTRESVARKRKRFSELDLQL